ncbi:hypothetical protein [Emticicia agri]|uniref:Uncharacterized protein n=1 Tax=Emticicia agri TaxID=2492393 RepID=A0A4Q5M4H7_9BACT|nr:hypothetical protein [Emticicia agri]RYU97366.1 hypothetical protein EWM59_01365 [Emticicia agri]
MITDIRKASATTLSIVAILIVLLLWHLIVAFTPRIKLAGLFLAKPAEPGYVWQNANHADARLFWQNTDVVWQEGLEHPEFKAESAEIEGDWNPLPGYRFIDKNKGLHTIWTPGLLHPDYMAWSDKTEERWLPVTGYRFTEEGDEVDCVWDPNKDYPDLKIKTTDATDQYLPYPGYVFVEPNTSLKVVWVPGTVNYEQPHLVAGVTEGTWNPRYNYRPSRMSDSDKIKLAAAAIITYKVISHL